MATIFAGIILVFSNMMGRLIVKTPNAGLYFRIAAMTMPLGVLNLVVSGWLRMQRRPWAQAIFTFGTTLINIFLTIWLVIFLHQGIKGVFVSQMITAGVGTLAAASMMKDWVNPGHVRLERLREMLLFALPLVPGSVALWIVTLSDRYFVDFYTSVSEVGLYSVGSSLAAILALATGAFQTAWAPFAYSIHKAPEAKKVYANVFLAYMWLTCAMSAGLGMLAPEAIRLVATQKYLGASSVVGLLALSYVMMGAIYIAGLGPGIMKDSRPMGVTAVVGAILNVACNVLLVPSMGKEGSAIATLISQAAVVTYLFYRSQKLFPIPYRFGPAVGLTGLALGVMWLGHLVHFAHLWSTVLAKVTLLVGLFIPSLFVLRIVTVAQARQLVQAPAASGR
jgi:O-antigen/teichoic acid export membrane protein